MTSSVMRNERRNFLKMGSITMGAIAITAGMGKSLRAATPHLDEQAPTAKSLGYKHDATTVDKAKFAKYKSGEVCGNCQLYQGTGGAAWGSCPIFSGKEVSAKGWCAAYVKKA